jgi:hypothetical protein
MKKILLIALSLFVLAGLASATPIMCGGDLMSANTNGAIGPACTAVAPSGFFISSLTLTTTDDYTGFISGTPLVSYFITFAQNPGFPPINGIIPVYSTTPNGCAVGTAGSPPSSNPCMNAAETINGNFGGTSTVQISAGNTVSGGAVTGASVVYTLDYAVTMIPVTGTPEPATLGLMGGALIGLGMLARRKK